MIRLFCEHCSRRVSVSDELAGKNGKCPDCGNTIAIPDLAARPEIKLDLKIPSIHEDDDVDLEEVAQATFNDLGLKPIGLANLEAGKRTKPWIIDIFLYPISTSGIINLVMLTLLPPLFTVIALFLFMIPVISFFGFFFFMFNIKSL